MNVKLLTVITILSLCLIFGFEQISYSLNKINKNSISELKILEYLPKNNKTIFISNSKISKITNDITKSYPKKRQDDLLLIKNSILGYLGINLSTNKLEEIYDNELVITSYGNKGKDINDILIIFKIKEKKDIDDLLNLNNKVDQPDKLIKIFRENKLNYLKYIYRTKDNYILTSSNKTLIIDALQSKNIGKKLGKRDEAIKELSNNFRNVHNILLTKNILINELLNNEDYSLKKDDYLATIFNIRDKKIILKSYLINNNKSLNIQSYEKVEKNNIFDSEKYQISIYNNLTNSKKYINHLKINSFEKDIFNELNKKLNQNLLFLASDNNWFIVFDKNRLSIENIKLLEDFNKNSLEKDNNIYTIYSKDNLRIEDNIIKKSNYKKIFSTQSENLTFISNILINDSDLDLISKEYFDLRGDSFGQYYLNKKIHLKNPFSIQTDNLYLLEKINYFFRNAIDISIIEFKEIIKETIPEIIPVYYAETNLNIF